MSLREFDQHGFSPVNDPMEVDDDPYRVLGLLKEIGSNVFEESSVLIRGLLSFLRHDDPGVVRQSLTAGSSIFSAVLTEIALQMYNSGKVEIWLEKLWLWMVQFKNAVCDMLVEPGSIASKVFAAKFLEICFLLFTTDENGGDMYKIEGTNGNFNASSLFQGHPTLNPTRLRNEAIPILDNFLNILKYAHMHSGTAVITVINCLASIAKKRPVYYDTILTAFLGFDPNFETSMGSHATSIQYALRIALLGFLRCIHPSEHETRDKLLKTLRTRYPGEVTEHTIRQMEKLSRGNERASRDIRQNKDDLPPGQASSEGMPSKRARFNADLITTPPIKATSDSQNAHGDTVNNISLDASLVNSELTPAEQMIVAIGAFLAEGDKGAQSLDLLLSQIPADLLADIVVETMKYLPKSLPPFHGRNGNMLPSSQGSLSSVISQSSPTYPATSSSQSTGLHSDIASTVGCSTGVNTPASDIPQATNLVFDLKRDPRRDPRRLDPRRAAATVGLNSVPLNLESDGDIQNGILHSSSMSTTTETVKLINPPVPTISKNEPEHFEGLIDPVIDQPSVEKLEILNGTPEEIPSELVLSPVQVAYHELAESLVVSENDDNDDTYDKDDGYDDKLEEDQSSSSASVTLSSEDVAGDLPELPLYVDLTNEQKKALNSLAITRLIEGHKQIQATDCCQLRLPLLARLVAQIGADDDLLSFFRTRIILDYHHHEGHDLAMHILYHLHTLMISELEEQSSVAANNYEKFLVAIATSLLDYLPSLDKSFGKLLVDAPFLPESALKMLEDLCQLNGYENNTKDDCDGDRVAQGLGAVWGLILERPPYRHACLDIALKCSVNSHEEVRAKAIRLVANKLFLLPFASENIEKFARGMMLSVVDHEASAVLIGDQMTEEGSLDTSVSASHTSDLQLPENEPTNGVQASLPSVPVMSLLDAQRQTSLFFALCSKKSSLLRLVFDIYGRAPKVVRQVIHRHVPGLVRTLGPSYPELLQLVSDPPEGSDNLIMLVLQVLTEEATPTSDLIAAVKHLYNTNLKDVAILIPMLSSLSKDEVLPIFPRLLDLPLEKFQAALARILQGSAHTGPALTPVEVLIAIHDVDPVNDRVALKKITDACTACFEQRTVFTQNVLAKSLSHMVERVPLPLLFMRTVIQAIGTFPALVDFVMEILSKLVSKQIWKMPKLWVGFLKLVSQTHPHSFSVLLQLPPPQLENALNKYGNLRGPLMAYANQPSIRNTLTRQTLQVLGLSELQQEPTRSFIPAA